MRILFLLFLAAALLMPVSLSAQKSGQTSAPAPNSSPTPTLDPYTQGFKDGLTQHQELLKAAQDELARIHQEVDKTKFANELFIGLYTLTTLLLLGDGFLSIQKQKSRSEEVQATATNAAAQATKAATEAETSAQKAVQLVDGAKLEMDKVFAARKTLFTELPMYLKRTIDTTALNPDNFDVFHQASVNEIDHLTFLGSPSFRFREPESAEELGTYCNSLLMTARGLLAQSRPAETLKRIEMFFELSKSPHYAAKNADTDRARMFGYRAAAFMDLLKRLQTEAAALRKPEAQEKVRKYRREISESLHKSKDLDANWSGSYFYRASFCSLFPLPPDVVDPVERATTYKNGQERAIDLYRTLVSDHAKLLPSVVGAARLNICCCLRRLADESGDYDALFTELRSLPSESKIRDHNVHDSDGIDQTSEDLWSSIMQDDVFFGKAPIRNWTDQNYKTQWIDVLDTKANVGSWRERYSYYRASNAAMDSWKIKAWEP